MVIQKKTNMLLFRFSEYRGYDFIAEHQKIIEEHGAVWMMKIGRRTNPTKLKYILNDGGYMILRAPKAKGGKYYIAEFVLFSNNEPEDKQLLPTYYTELKEILLPENNKCEYFKLISIKELDSKMLMSIVLQKNNEPVEKTISTTRTALMFVVNNEPIEI